jgi:predicted regulator of Ras-like GTPase activity (Roadblock/LC7/MglB family)
MKEILNSLNEGVGVRGSLVISRDGVVIASSLGEDLDEEAIAALASSIFITLMRPAAKIRLSEPTRFTLSAKHGRLIFEIMESLVLVVVTDKDLHLDITMLEIAGVGRRLQRMTRISV